MDIMCCGFFPKFFFFFQYLYLMFFLLFYEFYIVKITELFFRGFLVFIYSFI